MVSWNLGTRGLSVGWPSGFRGTGAPWVFERVGLRVRGEPRHPSVSCKGWSCGSKGGTMAP